MSDSYTPDERDAAAAGFSPEAQAEARHDGYTPEPTMWSFDPSPSDAIHQQSALEFLVHHLAADHHAALHSLVECLREEATEAAYSDPQVGIHAEVGYSLALEGLANLLAAECAKADRL